MPSTEAKTPQEPNRNPDSTPPSANCTTVYNTPETIPHIAYRANHVQYYFNARGTKKAISYYINHVVDLQQARGFSYFEIRNHMKRGRPGPGFHVPTRAKKAH